jgi:hypothetical protein
LTPPRRQALFLLPIMMIIIITIIKQAYAGATDSLTLLRVLLILNACGILAQSK